MGKYLQAEFEKIKETCVAKFNEVLQGMSEQGKDYSSLFLSPDPILKILLFLCIMNEDKAQAWASLLTHCLRNYEKDFVNPHL